MSEPLSEFLAVRVSPSMKNSLESIASRGVTRNVADHIRFAVERYIEGDLLDIDEEDVQRLLVEQQKAFGVPVAKAEVVKRLIAHWDNTKRDSYGYQTFA